MYYYALRQSNKRSYNSDKWLDCSLIDSQGFFRGLPVLIQRNKLSNIWKYIKKGSKREMKKIIKLIVKLKIFRQDTRPQMLQPMFFKRKTEI